MGIESDRLVFSRIFDLRGLAWGLLFSPGMNEPICFRAIESKSTKGREDQTVLVIGGSGGLSSRYREIAERKGLSLRHYENKIPPGARHGVGKIALVVIIVTMVSHALRQQVESLSLADAKVVYLKSASISALRAAIEQHAA